MRGRWPLAAFIALAVATVGASFFVQHLKVTTPLINGLPAPFPRTINPVSGGICTVRTHLGKRPVSFKRMKISFYLQNRADDVDVYVLNAAGERIRQIGFGAHMAVNHRRAFWWNGRLADGSAAPDGQYAIQVSLIHQARSFVISNQSTGAVEPVTVDTAVPHPRVASVSPSAVGGSSATPVTIHYSGGGPGARRPRILIYRERRGARPVLVKIYTAGPRRGVSVWDGTIAGRPARHGTYLIAVRVTNPACTTGTSPVKASAARHAIVTVG